MDEKKQIICNMRNNGATYKEISNIVELSYSRCRQIYLQEQRRLKTTKESGFPIDIDRNICNRLRNNGINNMTQLIEFVNNGGDITKLRKIGKKYADYINKMINNYKGWFDSLMVRQGVCSDIRKALTKPL